MTTHLAPILVFGPAYLDRVVRVDRPLIDPALGLAPLDRSVDGAWIDRDSAGRLDLIDPSGGILSIEPPAGYAGPVGTIRVGRPLPGIVDRAVRATAASDDLGGMGAGFAACLGGTLVSALGPGDDPTSRLVVDLLDRHAIAHNPVRITGTVADWTLLVSSGAYGDKLAVGFRGCHAAWDDLAAWRDRPARVRVVAGLPNRLLADALGPDDGLGVAPIRAVFPAARNVLDRAVPLATFAPRIDLLSCNRGEWRDLGDQAAALDAIPLLAITDGAAGASLRSLGTDGTAATLHVPAFPRAGPIRDTNRAGEAFAGALVATLLRAGWARGPASPDLARRAGERAAAASALVLGRVDFGFPSAGAIDEAVRRGVAGG